MRLFAYSFSRSLAMQKLQSYFSDQYTVTEFDDVIHVRLVDTSIEAEEGDVFIFPYGALVTWGLTEALEQYLCKDLERFAFEKLGDIDDDLYSYDYGQTVSIKEDHVTLTDSSVLNKLACSYGLAQSVKLGGFEVAVQHLVDITRTVPECLAQTGKINLSRKAIQRLIGKIFVDRASINLHLELLDAPNFFWEHTELEHWHELITSYMDQDHRVTILNQRLNVLHELMDMLSTELNNQHSSTLEWIIIILIFIEVSVMFSKEIFHFI